MAHPGMVITMPRKRFPRREVLRKGSPLMRIDATNYLRVPTAEEITLFQKR
jgi:hypothetical protein